MTKTYDLESMKTIFVNNLDKKITESELYNYIDSCVPREVGNIMIRKDDQYETAIAYVNMHKHESAKEVITKLNGSKVGNFNIRMSWAMSTPAKLNQNEANLFIKSINRNITQNELQAEFAKYGEILSCKLSMNEKGESNGFGYVKFFELTSAETVLAEKEKIAAVIGAEGFDICKYDKPRKSENTNLYIGNIHESITKEDFVKYFETFGPIRKNGETPLVAFFKVERSGKNKGFVNYENAADAEKALTSPKLNVLGEGELVIAYYKTKTERRKELKMKDNEIKRMISTEYKDFNLYVKTNRDSITVDEVKAQFFDCGEIYSVKVKYSAERLPEGVFYICMKNKEDKEKIKNKCSELHWETHDFRPRNMTQQRLPPFMMPMQMPFQNFGVQPMNYASQPFLMNILSLLNAPGGVAPFGHYNNQQMGQPRQNKPMGSKPSGNQKGERRTKGRKPNNPPAEHQQRQTKEPVIVEAKPVVEEITEDMKNDLGDALYDYIEQKHNFDEDLTGRITGVLLESIQFEDLRAKVTNEDKTELDQIIIEIKTNLENMNA